MLNNRVSSSGVAIISSAAARCTVRAVGCAAATLRDQFLCRAELVIGYPYSILAWVVETVSSWALPLDIERISSQQTVIKMGVTQVQRSCKLRAAYLVIGQHIIVADEWMLFLARPLVADQPLHWQLSSHWRN